MKNICFHKLAILPVLIAGFFLAVSCEKDVTELDPFDRITEAAAFATPERAELAMVGVYDAAQSGFYAGGQVRGYPFGAANVEQGDMRGEDMLNVAAFYAFTYDGTYSVASANNDFMWQTLFGVINKANIVIEGAQKAAAAGTLPAAKATEYEGEARFLRALAHHELLIHFARPYAHTADASHPGVPYRRIAVNTADSQIAAAAQGRNTVKECYDFLIEDLNFAEANLPETRAAALRITRAVKAAAVALKTRVYQHKGDWASVITEGTKLLGGTYSLMAAPEGVFASNNSNTESIFSIENSQPDNPGVNGALPVMYSVAPGRALVAISPILYNAPFWLASDLRRTQLTKSAANGYFSNKYRKITTQDDFNPILRLAEVVLNIAEAHSRQSSAPSQTALDLLNSVRNRAVTTPADQFTLASFATSKDLTAAILRERRIEFLGEGRRWPDIHRLAKDPDFSTGGVPSKVAFGNTTLASWGFGLNHDGTNYTGTMSIAAIPYDNFRFVWPIPQSELNTNPVLAAQQNPGY
jgi:hypothetical protein